MALAKSNKAHMRKWIAALRSGDYKQGTGRLRSSGNRFCCLGVACDISGLSVWNGGISYLGCSAVLPVDVRKWLGIEEHNPILFNDDTASGLNDQGIGFNVIADKLERKYLGQKAKR